MELASRIFVAGHRGLAGSAICRCLADQGYRNLILRTREELDLRDQARVNRFFADQRPEYVFLGAAKVGGIAANNAYPAEFIHDNLAVQTNVIDAAWRNGCEKLLFLGSSCVYPRVCPQPIKEEYLLTSALEPTNEWYAVAKIAGLKMAQAYRRQYGFRTISLMPTNLYGPNDNFSLESSHVLPALLRRMHEARAEGAEEVSIWGSGAPRREFLHVDDLASAAVFLMQRYDSEQIVNVGTGEDITIRELAEMIAEIAGFGGRLVFDTTRPDGTPRKVLDVSLIRSLGWKPRIPLRQGIGSVYEWFRTHPNDARRQPMSSHTSRSAG